MERKSKRLIAATVALVLALPGVLIVVAAQPRNFFVPSGSMEPTLAVQSRIPVRLGAYRNISQVKRGDIIVYTRLDKTSGESVEYITRIVALPGDKIQLSDTKFSLNGRVLPHKWVSRTGKVTIFEETNGGAKYRVQYGDNASPSPDFSDTVPQNQLFCLGDNRDNAYDSRYTGPVPFTAVVGKKLP